MNAFVGTYISVEGPICLMSGGNYALSHGLLMTGTMRNAALVVEVLLLIAILAATSSSSSSGSLFVDNPNCLCARRGEMRVSSGPQGRCTSGLRLCLTLSADRKSVV